jgi:hypothetical protein
VSEQWTTTEVAEFLGAASVRSASRTLNRARIGPVAREPGRSGQNLYDADEIRSQLAPEARPGQGRRTDLKPAPEETTNAADHG